MNKEKFIESLKELNIYPSNEQINLLEKYFEILEEYNNHTNLTRIISKEDVYLKHFYDSLTVCKVIDLTKLSTILDFGSGAGFPGIVLKIFFPHIKLTLLDSNNKKTKFLEYVSKELNIETTVINDRAENFSKKKLNFFDLVVARAVANMRVLTELSIPLVKENGYFLAMKANSTDELRDSLKTIEVMNSNIVKKEEFNLPDESHRSLILIQKNKKTKFKDLRTYDKILKTEIR